MKKEKTIHTCILIVGRSNFHKGSATLEAIISTLKYSGLHTHSYENRFTMLQKSIQAKRKAIQEHPFPACTQGRYRTQNIIKKIMFCMFFIKKPSRWIYFIKSKPESTLKQSQKLKKLIQKQKYKNIIILAHSAGGIISSLIYDHPAIKKIICFGYPFKHPRNSEEPYRTQHLQHVNKPMLIIQGRDDSYGGEAVRARYPLSSSIQFKFIEGNHDYDNLTLEDYADVLREIQRFIGS